MATTEERNARRAAIAARMAELHVDAASAASRATDAAPDAAAAIEELHVEVEVGGRLSLDVTDDDLKLGRAFLANKVGAAQIRIVGTPNDSATILRLYAAFVHMCKSDTEPVRAVAPAGGWRDAIVKNDKGGWTLTTGRVSKKRA